MSAASSHLIPDFYTWGFPGAPIQIHINLEVVTELRKQIEASQKDAGALSACGLLFGDAHKSGITRILDFKALAVLDAASAEAAAGSATGEVVGFYRTTAVCGVSMREEDKALAASTFRHPGSVFLLVEAGKSSVGDARFCFWGEGELFDWPLMLFPFDADELALEEMRRRSNKPLPNSFTGPTPVSSPADGKVSAFPEAGSGTGSPAGEKQPFAVSEPLPVSQAGQGLKSKEPVAKRSREADRRWLVPALTIALVALMLAAGFLYVLYFRRGSNLPGVSPPELGRAEVKVPLGLAVERRGNDLRVSWNGNAPLIAKADFGMLLIRGSAVSRDVPLSAEELRSGSVVYSSPADQVRFQLNVVAGEQVAREFLTVLMPVAADTHAPPAITKSGNTNAVAVPPPTGSGAPVSVRELRQFKPVENRGPATSAPQHIAEPPAAGGVTPTPVNSTAPSVLSQPVLNRPAVSAPATVPAPVNAPAEKPPQAEVPPAASAALPPVATHQVLPALPPLLRGALWKATVVNVNVSVDAAGSVVKAEAVATPGLHPLLRDAAVDAARRWRFRPAQFDGHAVPANMVLQFNFAASR